MANKIDPYNIKEKYFKWKAKALTNANSQIIMQYLQDMEQGLNVASTNKKGLIEMFINKTILTSLTMEIEITKITSKGQVVIPQDIRDKARIREGERFFVYASEDSIILKRTEKLESTNNIKKFDAVFNSMWKTAKKRGITQKDVESEIQAVRVSKK